MKAFLLIYEMEEKYVGAPKEHKETIVVASSNKDVWDVYENSKDKETGQKIKILSVEDLGDIDDILDKERMDNILNR